MENLYQSRYQKIYFEQETGTIHNTWLPDTAAMIPDDYKHELTKLVQFIDKYAVSRQLIDATSFQYTIDVDLQEWTDEEVSRKTKDAGIEKIAFITAQEIFSQMSIEQTMDGDAGQELNIQYFGNKEDAQKWLLAS